MTTNPTDPDVFDLAHQYADKHKAKVLLSYIPNTSQWSVQIKGDTQEQALGASPLEAYSELVRRLRLVKT